MSLYFRPITYLKPRSATRNAKLTIVSSPLTTEEMRSLPARAVTMVLCAPDTAGPWSAVTISTSSKNLHAQSGSSRWNLRKLIF